MSENTEKLSQGRLTVEEQKYIENNYETMTIQDIADQLKRSKLAVRNFIIDKLHNGDKTVLEMQEKHSEYDIQRTPLWREIQVQFTKEEQRKFLYHWANILHQFDYDVLSTEKMQILDMVRIELMLDRALVKIKDIQETIEDMKKSLAAEKNKSKLAEDPEDRRDEMLIQRLQSDIATLLISSSNFQKDYKDYLDKKGVLMKEIKGTREQRVKRIENSKETLMNWVAAIIDSPELRKNLGRDMEKMRLATKVEYERLSDYHKFEDGEIEQPILNAENIKEDNY